MNREIGYRKAMESGCGLGAFTEPPFLFDINGVIRVGAGRGNELLYYMLMGIDDIAVFEPHNYLWSVLNDSYGDEIYCLNCGLGSEIKFSPLHLDPTKAGDHSFLTGTKYTPDVDQPAWVERFDHIVDMFRIPIHKYDTAVITAEGMEREVLEGFGTYLDTIKYLSVNCAETPIYIGQPSAEDISIWLAQQGFVRLSPINGCGDVLFARETALQAKKILPAATSQSVVLELPSLPIKPFEHRQRRAS